MGRKKDLKKDLDEDLMDIREPEEGKKETLVDIICRNIRRDIIVGELIPGEKLMAKDLAEKYGTSETPVKLALNLSLIHISSADQGAVLRVPDELKK